jgi:hypothetical protein
MEYEAGGKASQQETKLCILKVERHLSANIWYGKLKNTKFICFKQALNISEMVLIQCTIVI